MTRADDFDATPDTVARPSRGFLAVLWHRKALVILPALLGLVGGSLVYWQKTPIYQSSAQILVIKKHTDRVLPMQGSDPRSLVVDDYMATHVFLLQSPLIIERAVKKKDLASLKTFAQSGDPVGQIAANLAVSRGTKEGGGNIIYLSFRGPVPEECAKVLTAVIESYQEFLDITYRNVSDQTLELIVKARDGLGKSLNASQEKYLKFRQQTPMLRRLKDGTNIEMERVASLEAKCSAWLIRQAELRKDIAFLEKAVEAGKGPQALAVLTRTVDGKSGADHGLEEALLPLKLQEKQLLESFGEYHPQVLSVRNRMSLLREHFEKTGGDAGTGTTGSTKRYLQVMREDLARTELMLQELNKVLTDLKNDTKDLGVYEIQEEQLRNDIARTHALHEATIKRLEELNLVRDSGGFDARTLTPPGQGGKVAPSAAQIITGGLLIGFLLGVGLAYLADFTDKSFRDPDEVRVRLGLPILGHIPYLKPLPEIEKKVESGALTLDPLLFAQHRPKSLEAEAYRAVRTALLFSTSGEGHRVVQVSSPSKGDGKSLLISNLAISLAQSGKRILLIDADCRRPRQHKVFGLENGIGLSSVIGESLPWHSAVQETTTEGLSLLPSGPIPPNPSELLSSPAFKELLTAARVEFDLVLVDTPPLLAVTDPCVVAGLVDGVLLVIRLSRHGRPQAERAREILKSLQVRVFGVVVNGVTHQGRGSLYDAQHYDYTENYAQDDDPYHYDADYYAHDETTDGDDDAAKTQG